jgi:hypothetical protein
MSTNSSIEALTRREVNDLMEHCRKIVVKDQDTADALETSESMIEATRYLEVYYKVDKYPYHDIVRSAITSILTDATATGTEVSAEQVRSIISNDQNLDTASKSESIQITYSLQFPSGSITIDVVDKNVENIRQYYLDNYVDRNSYYRSLQQLGIPAWKSRLAEDFEIIQEPSVIGNALLRSFGPAYSKSRKYFTTVMYTKAFAKDMVGTVNYETVNYYKAYCKITICLMTIVDLLNNRLQFPLDISYIDEYSMNQLLYSFGFTEFTKFPLYYRKAIALKINTLIRHKGTDQVFIDILDIFDFQGVNIIKYYLTKHETSNEKKTLDAIEVAPKFVGHSVRINSLQEAIKRESTREYGFDNMVQNDPYWEASKEEVTAQHFDFLPTKYFSIEGDFQMWKEVMNISYFVSMIRKLKRDHSLRAHLSLHASEISKGEVFIDELILAAQILVCDFYKIEDIIHFDQESVYKIYSFNDKDDSPLNTSLFGQDVLTKNSYANTSYVLETVSDYPTIERDELFTIYNHDIQVYNNFLAFQKIRDASGAIVMTYQNFKKYKALYESKFLANYNLSEYRGFSKYSEYLQFKCNADLYSYVDEAMLTDDQDIKRQKITYILSALKEYAYTLNIPFDRMMSDLIIEYIMKTVNVFKAYTVTMKDFRIIYRWDEGNFLHLFDSETKHAKFVWDSHVRNKNPQKIILSMGTVTNSTYQEPLPNDMLFSDSVNRFQKKDVYADRYRYKERYTFHGFFNWRDRLLYRDKSTFKGRFSWSDLLNFGDNLFERAKYSLSDKQKFKDRINYDTAPGVDYWYRDRCKLVDVSVQKSKFANKDTANFGDNSMWNVRYKVNEATKLHDFSMFASRIKKSDKGNLHDGYYMWFPLMVMPVSDSMIANDTVRSMAARRSIVQQRHHFADRLSPGVSSQTRVDHTFSFKADSTVLKTLLPSADTLSFGDSQLQRQKSSAKDRMRAFDRLDLELVPGSTAACGILKDTMSFKNDKAVRTSKMNPVETVLFGDNQSFGTRRNAADKFHALDRIFISFSEAKHLTMSSQPQKLTDATKSRGNKTLEETVSFSENLTGKSSVANHDRRAIFDRFVITVHQ